jgi:sugar lactone lactonase YvrE
METGLTIANGLG